MRNLLIYLLSWLNSSPRDKTLEEVLQEYESSDNEIKRCAAYLMRYSIAHGGYIDENVLHAGYERNTVQRGIETVFRDFYNVGAVVVDDDEQSVSVQFQQKYK